MWKLVKCSPISFDYRTGKTARERLGYSTRIIIANDAKPLTAHPTDGIDIGIDRGKPKDSEKT